MDSLKKIVQLVTRMPLPEGWDTLGRNPLEPAPGLDGVIYPAPSTQYHGLRPDGVYVPVVLLDHPVGGNERADEQFAACYVEAERLRAAGHEAFE